MRAITKLHLDCSPEDDGYFRQETALLWAYSRTDVPFLLQGALMLFAWRIQPDGRIAFDTDDDQQIAAMQKLIALGLVR